MENRNEILKSALHYAELGFSVFPVARDKKPLVVWQKYQKERASKEQIEEWYARFPNANVGVITGAISGIVVVDVDTMEKIDKPLSPTAVSRTGRGKHYFYKHPGREVKNSAGIIPHVDVRGDGGYVVMPPSIHESGKSYEWIISPDDSGFEELPQWVLDTQIPVSTRTDWKKIEDTPDGTRNDTSTKIIGKLLGSLKDRNDWGMAWSLVSAWNQSKCNPPLEEVELRRTFESIRERENKKRGEKEPAKIFASTSLDELMRQDFGDIQWVVENLIPKDAITFISGAPAVYKTWLTLHIALKIAEGNRVFDNFEVMKSPVLIVDEENSPSLIQGRLKKLSATSGLPIHFISLQGFSLNDENVQSILGVAEKLGAKVIIFDSFIRIHNTDENDASKMAAVSKHLKEFTKNGISVLITHHHRKQGGASSNLSQEMRGSSDILAFLDCHIAVSRKADERFLTLTQTKLRQEEEQKPFEVNVVSEPHSLRFEYAGKVKEKPSKKAEAAAAIKSVLEKTLEPLSKSDVLKRVGDAGVKVGRSTLKTTLEELIEAGEVHTEQGQKNTVLCRLNQPRVDDG